MQKSRRTVWRQVFQSGRISIPLRGAKTGRYANRGYRELIVDSYIIIYKIHARKKEVDIVTVQHGKSTRNFREAYKVLH